MQCFGNVFEKHWCRCFWRCSSKAKNCANDASNDINRPPLASGSLLWYRGGQVQLQRDRQGPGHSEGTQLPNSDKSRFCSSFQRNCKARWNPKGRGHNYEIHLSLMISTFHWSYHDPYQKDLIGPVYLSEDVSHKFSVVPPRVEAPRWKKTPNYFEHYQMLPSTEMFLDLCILPKRLGTSTASL